MRQAVPKNWSIYVVDLIHQKVVFSTHHAAVVGLTHHKVVVSQGRAEPTTFGGLNPPPFLQCIYASTCHCRLEGLLFSLHQTVHMLTSSKLSIWKWTAVLPNVCHLTTSSLPLHTHSVNELTSVSRNLQHVYIHTLFCLISLTLPPLSLPVLHSPWISTTRCLLDSFRGRIPSCHSRWRGIPSAVWG